MEHFKIKREEGEETDEFNFLEGDLEIIKNEALVHQLCTDEFNIKEELEEIQDETIKDTLKDTNCEIGSYDHHFADNCANEYAEVIEKTDNTLRQEKDSSIQRTSDLLDSYDGNIKDSLNRQCLDSFEETPTNEQYFKSYPTVYAGLDQKHRRALCVYTKKHIVKKSFESKLVKHNMYIHHKNNSFECNICDKKFSLKGNLVKHMRIHTNEKQYKCAICDYKSIQKSQLVTHMRIHTKEKPFECAVCGYKCSLKHHLVRHICMRSCEKPFECSVCNFKCAMKSKLVDHFMYIHHKNNSFECNICDKKFSLKANLVTHMRIHTNEKQYKCAICDYKSFQKGPLVTHMRIHTKEKPFECAVCGYKCSHKISLVRHMCMHIIKKETIVM